MVSRKRRMVTTLRDDGPAPKKAVDDTDTDTDNNWEQSTIPEPMLSEQSSSTQNNSFVQDDETSTVSITKWYYLKIKCVPCDFIVLMIDFINFTFL